MDPDAVNIPKQKENTGLVIFFHALVIIVIWLSPILFRWPIIIAGIAAYFLQIAIFGDCVLTKGQFETKKRGITFYYYLLTKLGFKPNMYRVRFVADYIMPLIIIGIALFLQIGIHLGPFIY